MKLFLLLIIVVACLTTVTALRLRRADDDSDEVINLNPTVNSTKECKTKDGLDGICIHESMCDEAHVFHPGGIIEDTEIREKNDCPGKWDWCCVFPNMTSTEKPDVTKLQPSECRTGQKESCPWCVALYRDGGNPYTKSPTGLFCGGAIIGSRVILTSASCVLAGKSSNLWVRLPGSTKCYTVVKTLKHSKYRSGTAEYNTALLVLSEDVSWPEGQQDGLGACLGLKTPLVGDCVTVGFNNADGLVFTPMSVTAGSCSEQGSVYDAACGRTSGTCSVALGSPVLCPSDIDGLLVAGVVRQTCSMDSVVLGSLEQSADWLREALTNNTIAASQYTP